MYEPPLRPVIRRKETLREFTGEEMSGRLFGLIIAFAGLLAASLVLVATSLS